MDKKDRFARSQPFQCWVPFDWPRASPPSSEYFDEALEPYLRSHIGRLKSYSRFDSSAWFNAMDRNCVTAGSIKNQRLCHLFLSGRSSSPYFGQRMRWHQMERYEAGVEVWQCQARQEIFSGPSTCVIGSNTAIIVRKCDMKYTFRPGSVEALKRRSARWFPALGKAPQGPSCDSGLLHQNPRFWRPQSPRPTTMVRMNAGDNRRCALFPMDLRLSGLSFRWAAGKMTYDEGRWEACVWCCRYISSSTSLITISYSFPSLHRHITISNSLVSQYVENQSLVALVASNSPFRNRRVCSCSDFLWRLRPGSYGAVSMNRYTIKES